MTLQDNQGQGTQRPPIKSTRYNKPSTTTPATSRQRHPAPTVGFLQLRATDPAAFNFLTGTANLLAVNVFGKGADDLGDRNLIPRYFGPYRSAIQMAYDTEHVLRRQGMVAAYTCDIVPISVAAVQTIRSDDDAEHRRLHPNGNVCQGADCPLRKDALAGPGQQARLAALVRAEHYLHVFQGAHALPTTDEIDAPGFVHPLEQKTGVPYGLVALAADVNADNNAKIGAVVQWLRYNIMITVAKEAGKKAVDAYKTAIRTTEVFGIYRSGQNPTAIPWNQVALDNYGPPLLVYVVGDNRHAVELGRSAARVVIMHQPNKMFRKDVYGSWFTVTVFIPKNADLNAARQILGEIETWGGNTIFMSSDRNQPSELPCEFVIDTMASLTWQRKPTAQATQATEAEADATA